MADPTDQAGSAPSEPPGNAPSGAADSAGDPEREADKTSAAPRNAATVVLARPAQDDAQIYMVRRSAKSPFMPSTLVFPGGRLDPEDGDPDDPATWERAAQRECREEVALDLAGRAMTWFDTWLTPSLESRRRYLARFFVATLRADEGEEAVADGHETHEGRWGTVAEHLAGWEAGKVDLPPPTVCILLTLQRWTAGTHGADAAMEAIGRGAVDAQPEGAILPKVLPKTVDGAPVIVMPHDPEYDATVGEAMPAPARVHPLPSRFVRDNNGWRPR